MYKLCVTLKQIITVLQSENIPHPPPQCRAGMSDWTEGGRAPQGLAPPQGSQSGCMATSSLSDEI